MDKKIALVVVVLIFVLLVFMCWPKQKSFMELMEEQKIYSQNGEDGITLYLKKKLLNDDSKEYFYVEFGVENGNECNTRILRDLPNWSGLLMDGSNENESINLRKEFITKENIVSLFQKYNVPKNINILSIDVDYNDFYILNEILKNYTCDIIICEYNSHHKPNEDKVVIYSSDTMWDGTRYFGASLLALKNLCNKFDYDLFYCDKMGVNAFFVNTKYGLNGDIDEVYKSPGYDYNNGNGGHKEDFMNRSYITSTEAMDFENKNIPKKIFMTHKFELDELPQVIRDNIQNTKSKNQGYEVIYYSDSDAEKFISENFPEYLEDYKALVPGAYKADLLRLLLLYKYGGVYNDIGHMYIEPISNFISSKESLVVCKDSGLGGLPSYYLHNAIIASVPGHPMIKKGIDVVIENIRNRFYGNVPLEPTGPGAFGKAFNLHFGRNVENPIDIGMFDEETKILNHTKDRIDDIDGTKIIKTKFDNYYETVYPGGMDKNYYRDLWNKREIYSTP